jgi:glucose/mannose transport system permease protein
MSLYALVIAGVWQSSGFIMALFLAGLRGVDSNIYKAAAMDGASQTRLYLSIILPMLRPVFLTSVVLLLQISIKSFDIVMTLTGGGPGFSSDLPATFMYDYSFTRSQLALGSATAMMMLATGMAIIVPYLYSELRKNKHA